MNINDIYKRKRRRKEILLNELIKGLCLSPNDVSLMELYRTNTNVSLLISKIVLKEHFHINYHKLASKICKNLLDNSVCRLESIDSFICSKFSSIHGIRFVNSHGVKLRGNELGRNYIESFKRNLMTNIRICMAQQQINQIKKYANSIDKKSRTHENKLNKQFKGISQKINSLSSKIYTSLITILGLFVAIMAAVFGSLQLFGSVFRNVDKLSHNGLGKAIILGSIIIFGTYLILILLFKGLSKLIKQDHYKIPLTFTIYFISCLSILFLLGTLIAYPKICEIINNHFKCMFTIFSIILVIILINVLIMIFRHHIIKKLMSKIKIYIHKHMHKNRENVKMKYINPNINFGLKPNISDLKSYLDKYHIITEINAGFLGVADPAQDYNVRKILNILNSSGNSYEIAAPMTPYGSLKCIFDLNVISFFDLSKIAELIISED